MNAVIAEIPQLFGDPAFQHFCDRLLPDTVWRCHQTWLSSYPRKAQRGGVDTGTNLDRAKKIKPDRSRLAIRITAFSL
jgi:hypothetical protein